MGVSKHIWDQLFTVDTILNIGETGDICDLELSETKHCVNDKRHGEYSEQKIII